MSFKRVTFKPRPHSTSRAVLKQEGQIYRQGKTPFYDYRNQLQGLDVNPADAATTGQHLGEIRRQFGTRGLERSVRGLTLTRGEQFTQEALSSTPRSVQHADVPEMVTERRIGTDLAGAESTISGATIGPALSTVIDNSRASRTLPAETQAHLGHSALHGLTKIKIHDDSLAHAAARTLNARAFVIGRSIYFGDGQYHPATNEGFRLLAHEVAHTVQQGDRSKPTTTRLAVVPSSSAEEAEANAFAAAVERANPKMPKLQHRQVGIARIMRQTFSRTRDDITTNNPDKDETESTFQIAGEGNHPHYFNWTSDVMVTGNTGDPFSRFEVGSHQLVRGFWLNVWWGTGSNRTHRTSSVRTPIRDAAPGSANWWGNRWVQAPFAASGDVRTARLWDSPGVKNNPFRNPIAERTGSRGWFNWGMGLVSFVSVRDRTAGFGANAFQHLGHVYWNLSLAGNFNTRRPVDSRVVVTGGGRTNRSGIIEGLSREFPAMHGGPTFNEQAKANLTTT